MEKQIENVTEIERMAYEMERLFIEAETRQTLPKKHPSIVKSEALYTAGYRKQEWISVDERLPESGEHCLVSCKVKRINGTHGQYVCVGYYAEKFKHLAYGIDDDCVSEYNEENDEYYIAEGWYEVIKNWDDYGFVAIDDFVTHWMPLPEAPKMKGGAE